MPRTRPPYPPAFRTEAVRLIRWGAKPLSEIAKDPTYDAARSRITSVMEALAPRAGDIEPLVSVKSRDLSVPSPRFYEATRSRSVRPIVPNAS